MRKVLALLLAAILAFAICGCDSDKSTDVDDVFGDDSVLSTEEQRQIYYDAVSKTDSMPYVWYEVFLSEEIVGQMDQNVNTRSVQIKTIDSGTNDARYSADYSDGDNSFSYFYSNGSVYSDESGEMYNAPMTENEFCDYMAEQVVLVTGAEFTDVTASENEDGTYAVSLSGMDSIPEALAKHFYKSGVTGLKLRSVTGEALVSEKGYLLDNSVNFELEMNLNGEAVTARYNTQVSYENVGQRFTITLPDENYIKVDDIRAPILLENAYSNIYGRSYNAYYESLYSYNGDSDDYSMKLDYDLDVLENSEGFEASDETIIKYDTISSGRTVKRSSQYNDGIHTKINKSSTSETEMTDASARSQYFQMIMDYEPDIEVFKTINIRDMGSYYEIEYEYTEEGTILYCQNVLTALIEDQNGIAVHSEKYTIDVSSGTIKVDRNMETLISHEIEIKAVFVEDDQELNVGFEHSLTVEML